MVGGYEEEKEKESVQPPATTRRDSNKPATEAPQQHLNHPPNTSRMWATLPPSLPPHSNYNALDYNSNMAEFRKRKADESQFSDFAFSSEQYDAARSIEQPFMTWPYLSTGAQFPAIPLFASNIFYNQGSDDTLGPEHNYLGQEPTPELSITTTNTITTTETKRRRTKEENNEELLDKDPCTTRGCTHEPRFTMRDQPKPKQRKSYKNENRYLLPNPTQVIMTGERVDIIAATCTVKLLDGGGNTLARQSSHYLENTEGTLSVGLEPNHNTFDFSLKVRQNSGPEKFRLCFVVDYETSDKERHRERMTSSPFLVQSNKSFFSKDPKVTALHPSAGLCARPTEVWIRGRDFNEKGVSVQVGDSMAEVLEVQPSLIVAIVPARKDLEKDTTVKVHISNVFKQKTVPSEQDCEFTYVVAGGDGRVHVDKLYSILSSCNKDT